MFKKLLVIIPVLGIIIAAAVQGSPARYAVGQEGQRVVLATDTGVVWDKSFNQDSYKGVVEFLQEKYKLDGKHTNYVDGSEHSKIGVINNYKTAVLKKADALVLPGFSHMDPLSDPNASFLDSKSIVLVDAVVNKPNVISIIFNAELSGLQAGFDAAAWATRKNDKGRMQGDLSNDGRVRVGVFGGAPGKYAVDNFMFGLLLGVELFNQTIGTEENVRVGYANASTGDSIDNVNAQNGTDSFFFSGSFALGDATKSGIISRLVDTNGADIIFPVAGPQVNDVISYQAKPSSGGYRPYIIGVDADQTLAHPDAAKNGRFINSAIKNLHAAVFQSLSHAKTLRQATKEDGTLGDYNDPNEAWDGTVPESSRNWAESTIGGENRVQEHALVMFDEAEGDEKFVEGKDDAILQIINFFHDDKRFVNPEDYLRGSVIKELVNLIKDKATSMINRDAIAKMVPTNIVQGEE